MSTFSCHIDVFPAQMLLFHLVCLHLWRHTPLLLFPFAEVTTTKIFCELRSVTQRGRGRWSIKNGVRPMPPFSFILNISWGFQFKHQVKLSVQAKALICALPQMCDLKELLFQWEKLLLNTHTDSSTRARMHIFHMRPRWRSRHHAAYQEAGGGVRCWTNGGMGEHAQGSMLSGRAFRLISSVSLSPWRCHGRNIISCCSSRKSRRGEQARNVNWTKGMEVSGRVQEWQLAYAVNHYVQCGWKR